MHTQINPIQCRRFSPSSYQKKYNVDASTIESLTDINGIRNYMNQIEVGCSLIRWNNIEIQRYQK